MGSNPTPSAMNDEDIRAYCQYPRCKHQSDLIYLEKGLCDSHWEVIAKLPPAEAYKKLGINRCT